MSEMTRAQAREALSTALLMAGLTDKAADRALRVLLDDERAGLLARAAGLLTVEQAVELVDDAIRGRRPPWSIACS